MEELLRSGPGGLEKFCEILRQEGRTQHIAARLEKGIYIVCILYNLSVVTNATHQY